MTGIALLPLQLSQNPQVLAEFNRTWPTVE
jgi:hypothetical protein